MGTCLLPDKLIAKFRQKAGDALKEKPLCADFHVRKPNCNTNSVSRHENSDAHRGSRGYRQGSRGYRQRCRVRLGSPAKYVTICMDLMRTCNENMYMGYNESVWMNDFDATI